ncbi:hypothetical protein HJG60_009985 [Phyllostomus discolor]|uniref:Uncharacterized protein n=1 Tax=Phyllostomus discolor TaxID=89673 RepID=A0A834ETA2_9CHIR|nr:hypothetical protein HJG60_009985 [Phyllostomus discolor]
MPERGHWHRPALLLTTNVTGRRTRSSERPAPASQDGSGPGEDRLRSVGRTCRTEGSRAVGGRGRAPVRQASVSLGHEVRHRGRRVGTAAVSTGGLVVTVAALACCSCATSALSPDELGRFSESWHESFVLTCGHF